MIMIMIMCPYSCCLAPAKQQEKHLTFSELFPESLKESAALLLFFFFLVSLLTVATLEKSECLLLYALAYLKRNQNENNVFYSSS